LRSKPTRLFDVLLAYLAAVWGDEPDALDANAFVYPWFRDVTTSWLFIGQQETPTMNIAGV
jgi:dsRNA-specific ribonuclease